VQHLHVWLSLLAGAIALHVAALSHLFSRAPGWRDQRWFCLAALSVTAYAFLNLACTLPLSDVAVHWASRAQIACAALHSAAWIRYSRPAGGPSRLERVLLIAVGACGALGLLTTAVHSRECITTVFAPLGLAYRATRMSPWGPLLVAVILLALLLPIGRFARAWRRGAPGAGVLAASLAVLLLLGVHDAAAAAGALETLYLVDLGFLLPVAAVAWTLTTRFVEDARQLSLLRADLARQVEERTRELGRAQEQIGRNEKLAAIGQLAAGVAHEVNNPASVVSANVQFVLASQGGLTDASRTALRDAAGAIAHVSLIARQLLDAGRLAADGSAALRPVRARSLADAALAAARGRVGAHVHLANAVPDDLHVAGHDRILQQVLVNLVVNGAHAVPEGRSGRVTVGAEVRAGRALLVVEDDGGGMAPDVLRRAFDPFFTTKPFGAGTGLGLSVSRGLVADLGGDLRLESREGAGTRAIVELAVAEAAGEPEVPPGADAAAPAPRVGGRRVRLLAVDDDGAVRAALARLLEGVYEVEVAGGVDDALRRLGGGAFDVVLCDVMMPDGGGERLIRALRERSPETARRVVFLTAGAVTEETRRFLAEQPQPVLAKPLDVDQLNRLMALLVEDRGRGAPRP
jgi:signal transduction histidine kinase/ActR/RegA family two-component response regulator